MKRNDVVASAGRVGGPATAASEAKRSWFSRRHPRGWVLCAWLVVGLGTWLPTSAVAAQAVFDPTADFSVPNGNPNGVWSYGWMQPDGGPFTPYTSVFTSSQRIWYETMAAGLWKNEGSPVYGIPTGWLSLHPNRRQEACALRWTAPESGSARIQGQFLPGDAGTMRVAVRLGKQVLWEAVDSGAFDLSTSVASGDAVDFAVFGGFTCGNTPLEVTVTLTTTSTQVVYDATADFSVTKGNPNGAWSYGWMSADFSTFNLHPTGQQYQEGWTLPDSGASVWLTEGSLLYGAPTRWVSLHPGWGMITSVLRWTAPDAGLARIQGQFLPGDIGSMHVAVRVAGQTLWDREDSGEFDLSAGVSPGAVVDFVVFAANGDITCGTTPLLVTIALPMDQSPIITAQPTGQNLYLGETAFLKIQAWGSTPLAYQWRKDGQDVPGATNAILTLANVTMAATGGYTVVVANSFGAITSDAAQVNVRALSPDALTDGLVGYWPFEDAGGTLIADRSGAGNNGTLFRGDATTWTDGHIGSALYCDGVSAAYVAIASSPALQLANSALTFAAWVRCEDTERDAPILAKEGDAGFSYWFGCFPSAKFGVLLSRNGSEWTTDDRDNGAITAGEWTHLVSVWDGHTVRHYQDSRIVAEGAAFTAPVWAAGTLITIGVNSEWDFTRFKGAIDDLRVYSRALSAAEVVALYEYRGGPPPSTYIHASLDTKCTWSPSIPSPVQALTVSGTRALVTTDGSEVALVDLGNPTQPVVLGSWKSLFPVSDAELAGNLAYIASYEPGFLSTIEIVDFSDSAKSVLRGYYDTPGHAQEITLVANTAYVADGEAGLLILDVSDPTMPRRLGGYDTQGDVTGVRVAGHNAYVADGTWLLILDVSDPVRPTRLGLHKVAGGISAFQVEGGTAYVHETGVGLRTLDVSDPTNVRNLGTYRTWSMEVPALAVSGQRAYLARGQGGVQVVDVSNPTNLLALASAGVGGSAQDVTMMGAYALVAAGEGGLNVFEFQQVVWPPLNPPAIADGLLTLSWPAMDGIRLQRTASLLSPDWQDVAGSEVTNTVSLPLTEPAAFFRLVKP